MTVGERREALATGDDDRAKGRRVAEATPPCGASQSPRQLARGVKQPLYFHRGIIQSTNQRWRYCQPLTRKSPAKCLV